MDDVENLDEEVESPLQIQETPKPSEESTYSIKTNNPKVSGVFRKRKQDDDKLI